MRRSPWAVVAGALLIGTTLGTAAPAIGQEEPTYPDGSWVGRFQALNETPTGHSLTVIEFTLETSTGVATDGEVTAYTAASESTVTAAGGTSVARGTVVDHDLTIRSGVAPPTFDGPVTWRTTVTSDEGVTEGVITLPDQTQSQTWAFAPRAVSCTSVSTRTGGVEGEGRFRTELLALRGESETVRHLLALIGVIETSLAAGDLGAADAGAHIVALVGFIRAHEESLIAEAACLNEIVGPTAQDPLRALVEPLIHRLLVVVGEVAPHPDALHPAIFMGFLRAALEAGALGPFAIDQPFAQQLEALFRGAMPIIVDWAADRKDVGLLQLLIIHVSMFGWTEVVQDANLALLELLDASFVLP